MNSKLKNFFSNSWFFALLLLFIGFIYFQNSDRKFGWTNKDRFENFPAKTDASGYYAYLPEWFLYQNDFRFSREIISKTYPLEGYDYFAVKSSTGGYTNKCYNGAAIILAPFFGIGHIHAKISGEETDGYSWPYMFWLCIGCISITLIGFIGLRLFLLNLGLNSFAVLFTVSALAFATNLRYYSTIELPMAHGFSFAVNSWILFFSFKWLKKQELKYLVLTALLVGLTFLIRPTNVLILIIVPFLTNWKSFKLLLINSFNNKHLIYALFALVFVLSFQFYNIYEQTGHFGFNTYDGESFTNWKSPYFFELLFGFNRGLFIYAPIFLVAIFGLIPLFKHKRSLFYGTILTFSISLYLMASWWIWSYGGAFGMRALIDFYPLYAIPISFFIHYSWKFIQVLAIPILFLAVYFYDILEFQYKNSILSYELYSNTHFKRSFLHTEKRFAYSSFFKSDSLPTKNKNEQLFDRSNLLNSFLQNRNKIFERNLKRDYFPNFTVVSDSKTSKKIIGKYSFDIEIGIPEEIISLNQIYYKNGKEIKKNILDFGCLINKEKQWTHLSFPIYPNINWKEIDSMTFFHTSHYNTDRFRNVQLKLNKKD